MKSRIKGGAVTLAFVSLMVISASVPGSASDGSGSAEHGAWGMWLDWSNKKGQEPKKERRRVIKDPLFFPSILPKLTDTPKKEPPAKPSN